MTSQKTERQLDDQEVSRIQRQKELAEQNTPISIRDREPQTPIISNKPSVHSVPTTMEDTIDAPTNIKRLIKNHQRRLQKLNEQKALFGPRTPPETLIEIEDTEAVIEELQRQLNTLTRNVVYEEVSSDGKPDRWIEIRLRGDFPLISGDILSRAVAAFAAVMGISPGAIKIVRFFGGSLVFDLSVPFKAIEHLRSHLESNSAQLHLLKVERVMLEKELGEIEGWYNRKRKFYYINSPEGSKIIDLLNSGLDEDSFLAENIQDLYKEAEKQILNQPQKAIGLCKSALAERIKEPFDNLDSRRYWQGKFNLLLASLYLNQNQDLKQAKKHYQESRYEFSSRKWFQLEALAYLGLAITHRKLNDYDKASDACNRATNNINQEAIPDTIDKSALEALRRAITREYQAISALDRKKTLVEDEKQLPIFRISSGLRGSLIGKRTEPKFLSLEEYKNKAVEKDIVIIDLHQYHLAQDADYILEIDDVDHVGAPISKGDWLLISEASNPKRLSGKTIAAVIQTRIGPDSQIWVGLKTFFNGREEDHYLLEAQGKSEKSIVVARYQSNLSKIDDFYKEDSTVEIKRAYDVEITGVVIDRISQEDAQKRAKTFIRKIPIVSNIAAGTGISIAKEDIEEYRFLEGLEYREADFGVRVVGNSMFEADIFPGDIALIHRQPTVEEGELAAIVITTPNTKEPLGVLKQYHIYDRAGIQHWFLETRNPQDRHLVVIPAQTEAERVKNFYAKKSQPNKFEFYEDAEIAIVGKYIGRLNKNQQGKIMPIYLDGPLSNPSEVTIYQPSRPTP